MSRIVDEEEQRSPALLPSMEVVPPGRNGKPWIPARYVMTILGFLGFFNLYALRVNMSVAIVAMVDQTEKTVASAVIGNDSADEICPYFNYTTASHGQDKRGEFTWSSQLQGIILGSFFYGYIFTQLAGAWVAKKFGPKQPFGLSALFSGVLALLIPTAAKWHVGALIATRILQGFFQGVCFPSMHTMISLWAPPLERTRMVAISYSGMHVGTVGALIISGLMADRWGWESIFYFFGSTSVAWYFLWFFLVFDSPDTHPRISKAERTFITTAIGRPKLAENELPPAVPWKKVLTSLPVWAIAVGHFGNNWGFYTLLTNLPTYFSKVLHFSLKENGMLSAMPYLALAVLMPISAYIADYLRRKRILSTTQVRRSFHFVGQIIPAACLIAVGYIGCDVYGAVTLLVLSVGGTALALSGFQVNHIDVSPTFAGTLMGLTNTLATIPGIVGPFVVGLITSGPSGQTFTQWRIVFFISAGIYLVTALFYALFASGEPAKWDRKKTDKSLEEHD
ncbi:Sialin [Hypsibius exemplaris]|uniref:Sialin n=1 Tax=Hypsibius exemplaris TaxID=2072580 RepID=A0A1W0WGY3_HYPEX|nr:Sialin [Hypsibius exemplaris]